MHVPSSTQASWSTSREIVDWHSHIWDPAHFTRESSAQLDANYAHSPSRSGSPAEHRAAMEAAGITRCVVLGLWSDHLGIHVPNEYVAEYVATWNGRAVGVASVDPTRDSAPQELRAAAQLGLRGVKLAPPYQAFHPHSEKAFAVYREAADNGMFLIFHQGAVSLRRGVLELAQPVLLDKVAREFPETPIIIAHMGQPWQHEVVPLLRKHPNVYADLSARCQRPTQLMEMLNLVRDYDITRKLLWGSDFPVFDPKAHAAGFLSTVAQFPDENVRDELLSILVDRPLGYEGIVGAS